MLIRVLSYRHLFLGDPSRLTIAEMVEVEIFVSLFMEGSRMGVYYRMFQFFHTSAYSPQKPTESATLFLLLTFVEKLVKNSRGKCSNEPSKSAVGDPPLCY